MALTPKDVDRAAETPPGSGEELNHLLHRADMTKTAPVKAFCGTEMEPWSGDFIEHVVPKGGDCIVCFDLWDSGMR
jgi:hypothetical protein